MDVIEKLECHFITCFGTSSFYGMTLINNGRFSLTVVHHGHKDVFAVDSAKIIF